ncbi:MAG: alpha/beta fold hydrolase [Candidatus Hydrogenedentes bacterium]|nr:alpha/beta fold hydrolase [Candidatus Hydrogenedentota bacterium]
MGEAIQERRLDQARFFALGKVFLFLAAAGFLLAWWPWTMLLYAAGSICFGIHAITNHNGGVRRWLWLAAFVAAAPVTLPLYWIWEAEHARGRRTIHFFGYLVALALAILLTDRIFPADRGFQRLREGVVSILPAAPPTQDARKAAVMAVLNDHPFQPAWWLRGQHFQTIWNMFRDKSPLPFDSERLTTPDGDFLYIRTLEGAQDAPQVLLLHGLEGSVKSSYILGFHRAFRDIGWTATTMEFRSCSGEINKTQRIYHMGETTDIDFVVRTLIQRNPDRPIYLLGFSLGANVVAKWLGEQGDAVPKQVRGAAVVSAPFNPVISAPDFHKVLGGLYLNNFLETLIPKALEKEKQFPGVFDVEAVKNCKDFYAFDTLVTAKLHGFKDAGDYYEKVGCHQFIPAIRVPTLLLTAADDPFNPAETIPWEKADASPWLHPQFSTHGGHVGFVSGAAPWRTRFWSEDQVLRFFLMYHAMEQGAPPATPQ